MQPAPRVSCSLQLQKPSDEPNIQLGIEMDIVNRIERINSGSVLIVDWEVKSTEHPRCINLLRMPSRSSINLCIVHTCHSLQRSAWERVCWRTSGFHLFLFNPHQVHLLLFEYIRRKSRSQTSDNIDRWESRGGKSQRGEEKKKEDQGRERVRRKKMLVHEKVGKSRFIVFFQWFVAPEGRKIGLAKAAGAEPAARWEMKTCLPLWCEVKMYKAHQSQTTFWRSDVDRVHAVMARSTFPSQKSQKLRGFEPFLTFRCRKTAH